MHFVGIEYVEGARNVHSGSGNEDEIVRLTERMVILATDNIKTPQMQISINAIAKL
jgi:hypothetical protein